MANFANLMKDHDNIEALAFRLEAIVESDTPNAEAALLAISELLAESASHRAKEDGQVYPALIEGKNLKMSQTVSEFVNEFADLSSSWVEYRQAWTPDAIAADWIHFRQETLPLMHRLRERVRRENEMIYPLALQTGAIRLR